MSLTSASDLPSAIKGAPPLCSSCLRAILGYASAAGPRLFSPLFLPPTLPREASLVFSALPPGAGKEIFARTNRPLGNVVSTARKLQGSVCKDAGVSSRQKATDVRKSHRRGKCTFFRGNHLKRVPEY